MATTTNFGWETPDDTDLVKDGAAAIRTALGGVDTSFVDLKGGTTGQVLAKATNTDLDYSWTTLSSALTLVNKTTIGTGVSTVSLNNVFTSTYTNYKVFILWDQCSASLPTVSLRLRASGTDNSGAFAYQPRGWKNTSATLAGHGSAGSSIALGVIFTAGSAFTQMEVLAPQVSDRQTGFVVDHYETYNNDAWGFNATHTVTASYDGFTVFPSSGTLTAGTIFVYGYGV